MSLHVLAAVDGNAPLEPFTELTLTMRPQPRSTMPSHTGLAHVEDAVEIGFHHCIRVGLPQLLEFSSVACGRVCTSFDREDALGMIGRKRIASSHRITRGAALAQPRRSLVRPVEIEATSPRPTRKPAARRPSR